MFNSFIFYVCLCIVCGFFSFFLARIYCIVFVMYIIVQGISILCCIVYVYCVCILDMYMFVVCICIDNTRTVMYFCIQYYVVILIWEDPGHLQYVSVDIERNLVEIYVCILMYVFFNVYHYVCNFLLLYVYSV